MKTEQEFPTRLALDLLLRPETVAQEQIDRQPTQSLDALVKRLRLLRALPMLEYKCSQAGAPNLAEKHQRKLSVSARQWGARQLILGGECVLIHKCLQQASIEHLFLKGVPMAFGHHAAPRLRPAQDIDILLRDDDLLRARDCIFEAGGGPIPAYQDLPDGLVTSGKHLAPIWSPNQVIPVELHARLTSLANNSAFPKLTEFTQQLWERAENVAVSGVDLPCPNPLDLAMHLILHSVYEDKFANGPLFLCDLQVLLETGAVKANELQQRADELGLGRGCALALHMLGEPIRDDAIGDRMAKAVAQLIMRSKTTESDSLTILASIDLRSWKAIRRLVAKLFPARGHLLHLRRQEGKDGGDDWSYPRLWIAMASKRLLQMDGLIRNRRERGRANDLLALKSWLRR